MLNTIQHIKAEDLLASIPDNSIDLIYTDPPYNISCKTKIFRDYRSCKRGDISFDFSSWDYGSFQPEMLAKEAARVLVDMGSLIVWCSEQQYGEYRKFIVDMKKGRQIIINMIKSIIKAYSPVDLACQSLIKQEKDYLMVKNMLCWIKTNPLPMFRLNGYRQSFEVMQWSIKGTNKKSNPNFLFGEQKDMVNYFRCPIVAGKSRLKVNGKSHPTQKPLSICEKIIKTHCRVGGVVLDPFAGTGTIPYAALETGRNFIAGDFDKEWVDAANERIKEVQLTF